MRFASCPKHLFGRQCVLRESGPGNRAAERLFETLVLTFNLINGGTYASVLSAMNNGSLRVGMHVIAFANGESESFITPTPGSMALLGLAGLCVGRRRR
ncbi:MAG: PEP-CTERM sorting domain-containing protein [Tepidisphaera sp.]